MGRKVDFIGNKGDITLAYHIVERIKGDLFVLQKRYANDSTEISNRITSSIKMLDEFFQKYGEKPYAISLQIGEDLCSPDNVNYCFQHGHYPEHASLLNDELEKDVRAIFAVEEFFHKLVSQIWNQTLTNFDTFQNGDDFALVVHSTNGHVKIPGTKGYVNNEYFNTTSISSSLITNQILGLFGSKLTLVYDVGPDNFICASDFDCATREKTTEESILTVKTVEERPITAGYSLVSDRGVSRTICPETIVELNLAKGQELNGEILNYDTSNVYNEVVLDKTTSNLKGALLVSNGCDILLEEYAHAQVLEKQVGCKTKVVNKGLYRQKEGLAPFTRGEYAQFEDQIAYFSNPDNSFCRTFSPEERILLVDSYIENVVFPAKYDKTVLGIILDVLETVKQNAKAQIR